MLLFHRAVPAAEPKPLFQGKWPRRACAALSTLVLLVAVGGSLAMSYNNYTTYGAGAPRSPLRGVWAVDEFTLDGQPRPPLLTDPDRWSHVTFDTPRFVVIRDMRDKRKFYGVELDEATRTITLTNRSKDGLKLTLTYERPEFTTLLLTGDAGGRPVRARLHRRDESEFLLTSRGFHWVNESPFNR